MSITQKTHLRDRKSIKEQITGEKQKTEKREYKPSTEVEGGSWETNRNKIRIVQKLKLRKEVQKLMRKLPKYKNEISMLQRRGQRLL